MTINAWIYDDITWCADYDCQIVNCIRNPKNMMDHSGLHSYANFRDSEECPIYVMEQNMENEREERK